MSKARPRIPKEVDDLIWSLTENGNPAAYDQFRARYPEYAKTLADRLQMVDRLKGSRPPAEKVVAPKFRPSTRVEVSRPFWSPLAVSMVVIALAATVVTAMLYWPRPEPPRSKVNREVPPVAQGFVPPKFTANTNEPKGDGEATTPRQTPPVRQDENLTSQTPAYLKPQSLAIRNAKLSLVVQAVAQQGKFAINIGPGLADPVISVDYQGLNSIEILQDLGRQYAFTPFDQGDGTVIIVPARDPNAEREDKSSLPTPTSSSATPSNPDCSR